MKPRAFLFDAYGTLFDVNSVVMNSGAGLTGDLEALSQLWRRKQLEATWLASLMERYENFWHLTSVALHAAVRQLSIPATERQLEQLMEAWLCPAVFEDARRILERLKDFPLAILSNGSPEMLDAAVCNNSIEAYFVEVISVDSVRTYKPSRRVYALAPRVFDMPVTDILFVSSNLWDAEGAKAFGYPVCWCNRSGAVSDGGALAPDLIVDRLDRLTEILEV
jgi:2-haloacid dehalogenase